MAQDHQTYRRAAHAALLGLAVQLLLALTLTLAGLYADSPAIYAGAWHLFGGLPIWCVLALVYYQHQLERIEALETERLTQPDAQSTALFDSHGDDLHLAKRRLNQLYRWGLPVVSLITLAYLLAVGLALSLDHYRAFVDGSLIHGAVRQPVNTTVLMVVMALAGFVAFVAARYESGMAHTPEWALLRGGASYLIGGCLSAAMLLVGVVLTHYGNAAVLAWLALVIPGLMTLVGVEVLLALVLNVYRPRKAGQATRPAFDSRMLGWMTSPGSIADAISDALNYQFGFEISRSWFYLLFSRAVTPLVAGGLLTMVLLTSLVIVSPHEQAVVTRFGQVSGQPMGPGLHLKLPWPIGRASKYATGRVHQVVVGSSQTTDTAAAALWTKRHAGQEQYFVTAPTPLVAQWFQSGGEGAPRGAAGLSLVGAEVVVQYRLTDLSRHVSAATDHRAMLTAITERLVNAYFMTEDIDTLLGAGRASAGERLMRQVQADADAAGLGLQVIFVGLNNVYPPPDESVAAAFLEQIGAMQERQSMVEQARQEAIEALASVAGSPQKADEINQAIIDLEQLQQQAQPEDPLETLATQRRVREQELKIEQLLTGARGEAAKLIYEARADRWERAVNEQAAALRFNAEVAAYRNAPKYFRAQRYLDVLANGLKDARKIILAVDQARMPTFRVDLKDARSTIDSLLQEEP